MFRSIVDAAGGRSQGHGRSCRIGAREPVYDPYSGVIYILRAKRADRVKLLLWDGTGLVLVAKRLEKSSFRWPRIWRREIRL